MSCGSVAARVEFASTGISGEGVGVAESVELATIWLVDLVGSTRY